MAPRKGHKLAYLLEKSAVGLCSLNADTLVALVEDTGLETAAAPLPLQEAQFDR
jgi:hypothetical protein